MTSVMPFSRVSVNSVCDGVDTLLSCWLYDEAEMRGV